MMYDALNILDTILTISAFIIWMIAGLAAARLAYSRSNRFAAWLALAFVILAEIAFIMKVAILSFMWAGFDWRIMHGRIVIALPYLLIPAAASLIYAIPRLWRLARNREVLTPEPRMAVPVQMAAIGSAIGVYYTFYPPLPPYGLEVSLLWILMISCAVGLWWKGIRTPHSLESQPPRTPLGRRTVLRSSFTLIVLIAAVTWFIVSLQASRLPDRMSMMGHDMDYGGGPSIHHHHAGGVSVTSLTGPRTGEPDYRITLNAEEAQIKLASGEIVDAWTYNGQLPGPEIRVREGDLVEVTLVNKLPHTGVTIHWHGLDVPNAEDGVAGLTQDAVQPGQSYIYRFRAEQVGTFWYHSHQQSSMQVQKGLFGALVVLPREAPPLPVHDITVMAHLWDTKSGKKPAFGTTDRLQRHTVSPGTPVKLRLVNTDNYPKTFALAGTPFQVAAIDGVDLHEPSDLSNAELRLAAGGRYDVTFMMPDKPVLLKVTEDFTFHWNGSDAGILLSPDDKGELPVIKDGDEFDPASYGTRKETPFDANSTYDREFVQYFDISPGFYNGTFQMLWTINGEVFPNTPMLMVREGELIKVTFINRSPLDHPMHLHGHHMLVLSRNGKPVTGSPWWSDTLNVAPGETYEVAFHANNPGIWMDHCHNLEHATIGMTMHLAYEGVYSPYEVGASTGNLPE